MNYISREIKAATDRLWFWLMPHAVRRYHNPRPGSRIYRYPAVGSEPSKHEDTYVDYKTAYRDSPHHIRYNADIKKQMEGFTYMQDPISETVSEKLIRFGYLTQDQANNTDAIARASQTYEQEIGEPVNVRVHHDDFGWNEQLQFSKSNPESIAEFIAGVFEGQKQSNATEDYIHDLDDIYNAHFHWHRSFDLAGDDPMQRQMLLDLDITLDYIGMSREELKKFPVFKSNPAYWAILDDSFSAENIKRVQGSVKNWTGNVDLTPVTLREGELPPGKEPMAVDVPHRSQWIDN